MIRSPVVDELGKFFPAAMIDPAVTVVAGALATGGIVAPIVTHLTWSLGMLFLLPPMLDAVAALP